MSGPSLRDLRPLLWSSIDNPESRDLDQVEFAERLPGGAIRVLVGIADVDALVPRGSQIDGHAAWNTTSVYAGVATFPMLADALSAGFTSLLGGEDRRAVVLDMTVRDDGTTVANAAHPALVRNHARLTYESVGAWLEGATPAPPEVAGVPGLAAQIRLQEEAALRLDAQRKRSGALDFETIEARPVVEDGRVVGLAVPRKNRARHLIENFMIAANTAMADLLESSGQARIQRVVREPERWPRIVAIAGRLGEALPPEPDAPALADFLARRKAADPGNYADLSLSVVKLLGPGRYSVVRPGSRGEGHFGLAVPGYTHSTAPNRRYADLVTQRLLKALVRQEPSPYTGDELAAMAQRCTERENAARKVERLMRKVAAAVLFGGRLGEVFDAIVTGASAKGTYVRTVAPPVEGRVVRGERDMDVADRVRVRLIATDPDSGHIDFERADERIMGGATFGPREGLS